MIKKLLSIIFWGCFSVVFGFIILILIYTIPNKRIVKNVNESAGILRNEDPLQNVYRWYGTASLDNITDSTMLLNAMYDDNRSIIDKAMLVYSNYGIVELDEENKKEIHALDYLAMLGEGTERNISFIKKGEDDEEVIISKKIEQKDVKIITQKYARYWHGYLVVLKPLLLIMSYDEIRMFNAIIQFILVIIGIVIFYKYKKELVIPFLFIWLLWLPAVTAKSLQYSSIFYITTIASLALFYAYKQNKNCSIIFLFAGISTAFFDFLTYPAAEIGILLLMYICIDDLHSIKNGLKKISCLALIWCFGYAFMWLGKWILASLLTSENTIYDATKSIAYRTASESSQGVSVSYFEILKENAYAFCVNPIALIAVLLAVIMLGLGIINRKKRSKDKVVLLAMVSLIPFLWYAFAREHSYEHAWFTCRNLIVPYISLLCIAMCTYKDITFIHDMEERK